MGSSGTGGNLAMTAGDTLGADAASGGWIHMDSRFSAEAPSRHISISTANAGLEGVSGSIRLDAGASSEGASDAKGDIRLETNVAAKGDRGDIRFHTGEGTQSHGGDIDVLVGATAVTATATTTTVGGIISAIAKDPLEEVAAFMDLQDLAALPLLGSAAWHPCEVGSAVAHARSVAGTMATPPPFSNIW
jgi:hypothetical protein